ncbi:MAG: calcium-binding protein, partial [Sulfuricurvum sp.]|uniref:beta strand repeat-containing protein n=1 Tax=Sulfuricurvum sp. TaxID=2025608 RepID=UPI00260D32BE
MATILSATVVNNILTITYDEAMQLTNPSNVTFYTSTGNQLGITAVSGAGYGSPATSIWTLTLSSPITSTEYVIMQSSGGVAQGVNSGQYLSYGTAFVGGSGVSSIDLMNVYNYNQPYSVFANNGADSITLSGGNVPTYVNLTESTAASDTVSFGDQWVNDSFSLLTQGPQIIQGFDISGTTTNDKLSMISNVIASNTVGYVDGTDVGIFASHSITNGLASFKDTNGVIITIDTAEKAQAMYDYLETNITTPGTTIGTQVSVDGTALGIYQKGATGNKSLVVALNGISGATLGTTQGTNVVQIVDTTGPDILNAVLTSNGINLYYGETVASALITGLKLYKNGTTDMGTLTQSLNGSTVTMTSSTQTLSATDFVVVDATATHAFTATDGVGNTFTSTDPFMSAMGGTGDNIIDLSLLTGVTEAEGRAGNDTITGTPGNDKLRGDDGNDTLNGGDGNDELDGGNGNDTLNGEIGSDNMSGGMGDDTYVVDDAGDNYWENDNAGNDTVLSYLDYSYLQWNVETLKIMNTGVASAFGNGQDNTIIAGSGDNIIDGGGGNDTLSYINATGSIVISLLSTSPQATGASGNDTIFGFENVTGSAYADIITGDNNANVLDGGIGNDTVLYDQATAGVTVNLGLTTAQNTIGAGTDTLLNFENLVGSNYDDTLSGNAQANIIHGGDGSDTISAGAGNDTIYGDAGNDFIGASAGDDYLDGGNGIDEIQFAQAGSGVTVDLEITTQQATGGGGNDTILNFENVIGSNYNDTIYGTEGDNYIKGKAGDDIIYGRGGNDFIGGGDGNDTVDGGNGIDTFTFENATGNITANLSITTAQNTGYGNDTILNFENLDGSAYNDTLIGNSSDNQIKGNGGNDTINGGNGTDTALYTYASNDYTIIGNNDGSISVTNNITGSEGSDILTNIEFLQFSDTIIDASLFSNTPPTSSNATLTTNEDTAKILTLSNFAFTDIDSGDILTKIMITTLPAKGSLTFNGYSVTLNQEIYAYDISGGNLIFTPDANGNGNTYTSFGFKVSDGIAYSATANTVTFNVTPIRDDLVLTGTAGSDTLNGDAIDAGSYDTLSGLEGNDTLLGLGGNDILSGGLGDDIMDGGAGVDTLTYITASA